VRHTARMRGMKDVSIRKVLIRILKEIDLLEDLDADGRIIVNFISNQTGCRIVKQIRLALDRDQ
jgi:hypothetical protein